MNKANEIIVTETPSLTNMINSKQPNKTSEITEVHIHS